MSALKKLVGAYLVLVAVAVAFFFIVNAFLTDAINVLAVWVALDIMMAIALPLALIYNYSRKRAIDGQGSDAGLTRGYFEANAAFFITAGVVILFFHNWFSLLANGPAYLGASDVNGNHQAWVIWAAVDTFLPIILGVTGCHMWRNSD